MSHSRHRRRFLQQASAIGTTLGAHALCAGDTPSRPASDRVILGVMGLGRGQGLAKTFSQQPNVELRYLCDVDQQRVDTCQRALQPLVDYQPQAVRDVRRILDDPDVNALVCAAPNHWHAPVTILACQAGKHVYVEKPCSHNPWEGEMMIQVARQFQRAVQVGTQRRSNEGVAEAIQLLSEGAIGRVYLAHSWYNNLRGPIGHGQSATVPPHLDYELWQGPAPRREYRSNVVHYNWHWRWHWGNGELGNNGVHALDLCRAGLGVDFPRKVTSSGGRYAFQDDQETPDTQTVCLEFSRDRQITWQGLSCNRHGGEFVTFYGTDGTLELDATGAYRVLDRGDHLQSERKIGDPACEARHAMNFLSAIRNDQPESLTAEVAEGHKSALLCHLGNIAQRTGRALQCDPSDGRIREDPEAMQFWQRQYAPGWTPKI